MDRGTMVLMDIYLDTVDGILEEVEGGYIVKPLGADDFYLKQEEVLDFLDNQLRATINSGLGTSI